jgi:hypothetical protein
MVRDMVRDTDEDTVGDTDEDTVGDTDEDTVGDTDEDTVGDTDEDTVGDTDEDTDETTDEVTDEADSKTETKTDSKTDSKTETETEAKFCRRLTPRRGTRHALRRSRWERSRYRQGIASLAFGALDGTGCVSIWATDGDGQRERRRAERTSGLDTGALPRTPGLPSVRAKCWARNRDAIR